MSGDSLEIMSMEHVLCFRPALAIRLLFNCNSVSLVAVVCPLNCLLDHMFCYIMLSDHIFDGGDYFDYRRLVLKLWCLTPLTTISKLYCGCQFYW